MAGNLGMRALVGALLVMVLASAAGTFTTVGIAQTESSGSCGVDFAAMLESAVNSAMYTLMQMNVSTDSASWSLIIEANASVSAIAQAQAAGQCSTAMGIYLNATKKISQAIAIAKKEAAASVAIMEEESKLVAEVKAEIRAVADLENQVIKAYEKGRINASTKAELEAKINESMSALIRLEARINASIEAGNLTASAIQAFKAELSQIKASIKEVARTLNNAIAESYKAELRAEVKAKLSAAIKEMQKLQMKLEEKGVCQDLPDVCLAINQSIEHLMNLSIMINQSINTNMSATAAMAAAAHAIMAAEGLMKAVANVSTEVNTSIELHMALKNATIKLEELKQALIDLKNEMASKFMPTHQIEMLIEQVDAIKGEMKAMANHSHRHGGHGERERFSSNVTGFFNAVAQYMAQLNQSAGMDAGLRAKIEAVLTKLVEAEAAVNITIKATANASVIFNKTCEGKAEALLKKSVKIAISAEKTLQHLGMSAEASAMAQAVAKLEAAIQAVKAGDNATAIQDIDAAVTALADLKAQLSSSHSSIIVSVSVKISVSIDLATAAKAQLQ